MTIFILVYYYATLPVHNTTPSRHAGYVIEKLRKLRKRACVWYIGWLGVEIAEGTQLLDLLVQKYKY